MSSNELDLYSPGQLAPVGPGAVDLYQGDAESHWGDVPVDYLSTHQTPFPSQQVEQNFNAMADTFERDFQGLGYVQRDIDAVISWFKQSLTNPPKQQPRKHNYNLYQYSNDPVMNAFANYAATKKLSAQMVAAICYWCQEFENLVNGVGRFAGVQAPTHSSDPTDALSDAEYDRVVAINDQAAAATKGYLADLWGSSYAANMRVVNTYYQNLPAADQAFLSQYAQNWVRGTNSVDVLLGLYRQAIGSGSLPRSGAEVSREIASIENVMRTERAKYMKDDQLQARYRELLRMRGY